ncbi:MAG: hypothetical protein HLUCCO07_00180 [Rhodobacteraceae bacterium HLUCCO07]|nr:MAG: hypothetical protein HLUCCO07_00180 [Rhodobacteraceae bacterium HLUCCO07]
MKLLLGIVVLLWPGVAMAETDFRALTDAERRILGAEIREVILENPSLVSGLSLTLQSPYPAPAYEEEIAADHALIARHADALFDDDLPGFGSPTADNIIALFTAEDCPACAEAERDLRSLSESYDLKVMLIDRGAHGDLADALEVGELPFYVMPRMMIQGHMPAPVLAGYLENGTGQ